MNEDGRVAALTTPGSLSLEFRDQTAARRLTLETRPDGAPNVLVGDKGVQPSPQYRSKP
jgi:hypothetical protein